MWPSSARPASAEAAHGIATASSCSRRRSMAALFRVAATGGTPTPVTVLDRGARGERSRGAAVPARRPSLPVRDHRRRRRRASTWRRSIHLNASACRPKHRRYGFSSPDLLFFMRDRTLMAQRFDLNRLELTGEPIRVAEGVDRLGPGAAFAVSASGTLVYWAGGRDITQPTWFQRNGTAAGTLGPPAAYMNVALSSDGRQAAVDRFDLTPGIWLLDAARGTATRATSGEDLRVDAGLVARRARLRVRGGARHAAEPVREADWHGRRRGTPVPNHAPELSAKLVSRWTLHRVCHRRPEDRLRYLGARRWPAIGSRQPFLQTQFDERHARISPDGRWMAYSSNESGRGDVYVTRFPEPVGKWQVSTHGGGFPVWRRDGRELFYRGSDGTLMAVPIAAGSELRARCADPALQAAGCHRRSGPGHVLRCRA